MTESNRTPLHRLAELLHCESLAVEYVRSRLPRVTPESKAHAGLIADCKSLMNAGDPYVAFWAGINVVQHGSRTEDRAEAAKHVLALAPEAAKKTSRMLVTPEQYYAPRGLIGSPSGNSGFGRERVSDALAHVASFAEKYMDMTVRDAALSPMEASELYYGATTRADWLMDPARETLVVMKKRPAHKPGF